MSEQRTIFEIFADVKREVRPVGKDSYNEQQRFKFRGIDAVVNAAAPALDKHGVLTVPTLEKLTYSTVEVGSKRTQMAHAQVEVTYTFYGPRGDHFCARVPGEAMDMGDKATAKAMSVAYRIALLQALNLPTDDPDPDSQSYERSPARDEPAEHLEPARRPATADREWLHGALDNAGSGTLNAEQCRALWRESAEKVHAGTVTRDDAQRVQDKLRTRLEQLGREAKAEAAA